MIGTWRGALGDLDRAALWDSGATALAQRGPGWFADRLVRPSMAALDAERAEGAVSIAHAFLASRMVAEVVDGLLPAPEVRAAQVAVVTLDDPHLLGKALLRTNLAVAGWRVADYGVLSTEQALARLKAERPALLLISASTDRSVAHVRALCAARRAAGLSTRVAVGGAPFLADPSLWTRVGADAMGATVSDALRLAARYAPSARHTGALTPLDAEGRR